MRRKNIFLAIDIGNTIIHLGFFFGKSLRFVHTFFTEKEGGAKRLSFLLGKVFKKNGLGAPDIQGVIICSVVPTVQEALEVALMRIIRCPLWVLGRNTTVPIKNTTRQPSCVGQDRLVNAYAGWHFYGGPLVIVDFGTAITFDVVSRRGHYLGGIISAGLAVSLKALFEKTALLPKVEPRAPRELIGKDTVSAMLSGAIYGTAFLTDGLLVRLKRRMGPIRTLATGGQARLVVPHCKEIQNVDPHLTLKGLQLISSCLSCPAEK